MEPEKALIVFKSKKIRRSWFRDEWFYSLVDIIQALTDSPNPTDYLKKLRKRDTELGSYIGTYCPHVEMQVSGGKKRTVIAGSTLNVFRLIQSIPSRNAEPFKRWLAKVGKERVDEIENPELAQQRMKDTYTAKGYSQEWIDKRLRRIAIRLNLTDEWKERGIDDTKDFAILTAEISKATFGMTPVEYKYFKSLPRQSKINLRDHMDDLELIFTMLGEKMTTELSKKEKPDTFSKNKLVAKRGGTVAGNARVHAENELGRPVSSQNNYLSRTDLPSISFKKTKK